MGGFRQLVNIVRNLGLAKHSQDLSKCLFVFDWVASLGSTNRRITFEDACTYVFAQRNAWAKYSNFFLSS